MGRPHYRLRDIGTQLHGIPASALSGEILIVAGDDDDSAWLAATLPHCRLTVVGSPQEARQRFLSTPFDLVILNHSPHLTCLELLPAFKSEHPSVPIVVTTACGSEELAVEAFRRGAIDYFRKPLVPEELVLSLRAILEIRKRLHGSGKPLPVAGMQRALRYLESNFQHPLRLDTAACEAGMSVSSFERSLKHLTGLTFVAYLNGLRLAKAKELLLGTSVSMLQIALACGFGSQAHFNRVFRKLAGTTPGLYRRAKMSATSKK